MSYKPTEEKGKCNAWKLTIFDGNENFAAERVDSGVVKPGNSVSVNITSMGTVMDDVDYDQISAMLVDESDTVISYGKIKDIEGNGIGTVDIGIPEGVENGKYTLKLFAEDMLYEEKADYMGFGFPTGSLSSNAIDFELEVDGRNDTGIEYNGYHADCVYSGSVLTLPNEDELMIRFNCCSTIERSASVSLLMRVSIERAEEPSSDHPNSR